MPSTTPAAPHASEIDLVAVASWHSTGGSATHRSRWISGNGGCCLSSVVMARRDALKWERAWGIPPICFLTGCRLGSLKAQMEWMLFSYSLNHPAIDWDSLLQPLKLLFLYFMHEWSCQMQALLDVFVKQSMNIIPLDLRMLETLWHEWNSNYHSLRF